MPPTNTNLILGVSFIVVGILVLVGRFPILSIGLWLAAIALIVLGILVLLKKLPGTTLLGAVLLIIGLVLILPGVGLPNFLDPIFEAAEIVIGVLLVIFGVMRLTKN